MINYTINGKDSNKIVPRQTDIPRNERIRAKYAKLNAHQQRIYSIRKLANIFHLSPARIHAIIHQEAQA